MNIHDEYLRLIEEQFAALAKRNYEDEMNHLWLKNAPEQYLVEASMLSYFKMHPNATSSELCNYFDLIAPEGLAPGDDGTDLLDDD